MNVDRHSEFIAQQMHEKEALFWENEAWKNHLT